MARPGAPGLYNRDNPTFYLPPAHPQATYFSTTDDFVSSTGRYATGHSGRLLIVGHPYFTVPANGNGNGKVLVPKVNANQYRVFRCILPDPNKVPICQGPEPEGFKYVWRLRCVRVGRGQPFSVGLSGAPKFNRGLDLESVPHPKAAAAAADGDNKDQRVPFAYDPKQMQILIVGCAPAKGEYWHSKSCNGDGSESPPPCPAIELQTHDILDGSMCDIGTGSLSHELKNPNDLPLELVDELPVYPDVIGMQNDPTGDSCFFMVKREQLYLRHAFLKDGTQGEPIGTETTGYTFSPGTSGSLINSDTSLFGKPYYLNQAQGANNGVVWDNTLYITLLDNTRNNTMVISSKGQNGNGSYDQTKWTNYLRHVEEYDLHLGLELCKVDMSATVLYHMMIHNPGILDKWGYTTEAPTQHRPPDSPSDTSYRYSKDPPSAGYSGAISCHAPDSSDTEDEEEDFFEHGFWNLDFRSKINFESRATSFDRAFLQNMPSRPAPTKAPAKRKKK